MTYRLLALFVIIANVISTGCSPSTPRRPMPTFNEERAVQLARDAVQRETQISDAATLEVVDAELKFDAWHITLVRPKDRYVLGGLLIIFVYADETTEYVRQ